MEEISEQTDRQTYKDENHGENPLIVDAEFNISAR